MVFEGFCGRMLTFQLTQTLFFRDVCMSYSNIFPFVSARWDSRLQMAEACTCSISYRCPFCRRLGMH